MLGVKVLLFVAALACLAIVIVFTWCPPLDISEETTKVIISVAAIAAVRVYKDACDVEWQDND